MAYDGERKWEFDYVVKMELLYLIDDPAAAAAMAEVDPELVTMIRNRYQVWHSG